LKTFGETGFHCLAAARVADRYPREAFACGLRVLGEGQLSLTKFLILTDGDIDITNFPKLWTHVLERIQWDRDLFVFANVSQDTLDYTGPSVNKGSKAIMLGLGKEKIRNLPTEFSGNLPTHCTKVKAYLPGTLVLQTTDYEQEPDLADKIAKDPALSDWPAILLVDNCEGSYLFYPGIPVDIFYPFEPAADIHGATTTVQRFHVGLTPPVVFDCRMKPWYTDVLEVDDATRKLVDSRINILLPPTSAKLWKQTGSITEVSCHGWHCIPKKGGGVYQCRTGQSRRENFHCNGGESNTWGTGSLI